MLHTWSLTSCIALIPIHLAFCIPGHTWHAAYLVVDELHSADSITPRLDHRPQFVAADAEDVDLAAVAQTNPQL